MLDKNDITLLRGMFRENNEILHEEMRQNMGTLRDEMRQSAGELRAEMRQNTEVLHGEMVQNTINLRDEIHAAVNASEKRITTNIAELLDTSVLPQIADLQRDMTLVKRHLQLT